MSDASSKATVSELLKQIPGEVSERWPEGARSVVGLRHGPMSVKLFAPGGGIDGQMPHLQDEVYFVIAGGGTFVVDGQRHAFAPGTAFFVRAGAAHRFEDFTPDFVTWVVFWGPEGGDSA